jgi:WD40 repeat protein/serine/threonine protein kinase
MNNDAKQAKAIFLAAVEQYTADQWAVYLDEACAGDPVLRQEVEVLLRAHSGADSLFDHSAASPVATLDEPTLSESPGTVIGPYKLLEQIGVGGFGVVFMAEQKQPLRRKVALKVLKPGMDTRQVVARFEAERQALALMDHPNIARVIDGGETAAGRPYFVMELVKGIPITDYCDQNQLTVEQRLELFLHVCQAVQHAHQKGIIHRDLKPANVLVTLQDGAALAKVIDFGIAKAIGQQLTDKTLLTSFAQMIGSPLYMSPEQAALSNVDVDTRSDVYSLGVLLYELLTGTTPFEKDRFQRTSYDEMRRIIREEEPPRPSTRISTLGQAASTVSTQRKIHPTRLSQLFRGELDWIVMKCLEKDRNRRYETASALAADVQRYLHDEPVQACPPSAGYRFRKLARRNRGALTTGALLTVALVVAVVALAVSNVWVSHERDEKAIALQSESAALAFAKEQEGRAKAQQGLAEAEAKRAGKEEKTARHRFNAAQMNLAYQAWEAGQPARVLELLEGQRPKLGQEDLRGFEWYYLWRLLHQQQRLILRGHKGEIGGLAFSPDGRTLASADSVGIVKLWDVASGGERATLVRSSKGGGELVFSPDGKILGFSGGGINDGGTMSMWEVATGQPLTSLGGAGWSLAFSPDGRTLARVEDHGDGDDQVRLWDLANRQTRAVLRAPPGPVLSLAFSPDGKTLATVSGWDGSTGGTGGRVRLWDLTVTPVRAGLKLRGGVSMKFSPDGKLLAVDGWNIIRTYEVATGQERASFRGHIGRVSPLAFSSDGMSLVSAAMDRTVRVWDVPTRQQRASLARPARISSLALSPDGKTFAYGSEDRTVRLWNLEPPTDRTTIQQYANPVYFVAFSPDSKLLISGGEFEVRRWNVATGQAQGTVPIQNQWLAISPDGKTLASRDEGGAKLWDVATGERRAIFPGKPTSGTALAFSADGKTLAMDCPDGSLQLWDVADRGVRTLLVPRVPVHVDRLAFSPDGRHLAAGEKSGTVQLWDTVTGQPGYALAIAGPEGWAKVAYSPDGKTLAAGYDGGSAKVWDTDTGKLRASLNGHTDGIDSLVFFPDGTTLATGSRDGTIKLWDVLTGQERATLKGHKDSVFRLAVARDGTLLASGSLDGTVRLWRADRDAEATAYKGDLDPDDPDSPVAHNNLGDGLRAAGKLNEAVAAYGQAQSRLETLTPAFPGSPEYSQELARTHIGLAQIYVQQERWANAADELAKASDLAPENVTVHYWHALTRVGAGDQAGYRSACATLLQRFGQMHEPDVAHWVAWTSVLAPDAVEDWDRPVKAAETAVRSDTLGATLYRAGRFSEALRQLKKVTDLDPAGATGNQSSPAYMWFFLAMAHQRLGQTEEGRKCLDEGIKGMEQETRNKDLPWNRRLTLQLLRHEAEALVKGSGADQNKAKDKEKSHAEAPGR